MASESNAEDFVLRLHEVVSGPAKVAESALAQLEAKIIAERAVVAGLEQQLGTAAAKLRDMADGTGAAVSIDAYRKQQAEVIKLEQKAAAAAEKLKQIAEGGKGGAASIDAYRRQQAALGKLEEKAAAAKAKLQELGAAGGGAVNIAGYRQQQAEVLALQKKLEAAAASARKLEEQRAGGGSGGAAEKAVASEKVGKAATVATAAVQKAGKAAAAAKVNYGELGESLGRLGGPLGVVGQRAGALAEGVSKLSALGPAGIIVAITVAVVALTAALAAGVVALTRWAVGLADAARNQKLTVEGLVASYAALRNLSTILPDVQAKTGLASDELQRMAAELAKAKVPAQHMRTALTAIATATAGGASAEFIEKLRQSLVQTGKVAPELAAQFARFESIAARKMLSLDQQGQTFKRHVGALFADLNIEPLLDGVAKLVKLFDTSTASGRALKFLLEQLFQPLIDGATSAIPAIERAFLKVMIAALKAYISIKQAFNSTPGAIMLTVLKLIAVGFASIVAVVGLVIAAIGVVVAVVVGIGVAIGYAIGTVINAFGAIIDGAGAVWTGIKNAFTRATNYLKNTSWTQIGTDLVTGLASGIKAAAGAVLKAITGVVGDGIAAAKQLLGIKSPSKVFELIGVQTGEGMALGLDRAANDVQDSMADVAAPPEAATAPNVSLKRGGEAGRSGGGRSLSLTFNNCQFGSVAKEQLEEWLVDIVHRHELDGEPEGSAA